jgi:hypothetical protein
MDVGSIKSTQAIFEEREKLWIVMDLRGSGCTMFRKSDKSRIKLL